jgi:hypothetical protein
MFLRAGFTGLLIATALARNASAATPTLPLSAGFDTGLDGWTIEAQTGRKTSGGNPGGYLETFIRPFDSDYGNVAHAPAAWLGNWTPLEHNASLAFDYKLISVGNAPYGYGWPQVFVSGPGGAATWGHGPPITQPSDWITYTAPIEQTPDWQLTSGTWSGLLANVTDLGIHFATVANNDYPQDLNGLDNVRFTGVPEPVSTGLLVACAACAGCAGCRRRGV